MWTIRVGFTIFPFIVASGTKNTYVECTKAPRPTYSTIGRYLFVKLAGFRYGKLRRCRRATAASVPALPKGLIALLYAYGAIKPLGSMGFWDPAVRAAGKVRSANHHGCAAVKRARQRF